MKKLFVKSRLINLIIITAILFSSISCDDNVIVPDVPEITNINGNWNGTTSENKDVSFTVTNNSVTEFIIKFESPAVSSNYTYLSLGNVVDNAFSFSSDVFGKTDITGEFLSNTSSGGTFTFDSISVTWSATKQ